MKNTSLASGEKAKISSGQATFSKGANAGIKGEATMRHRPEGKWTGSTKQPLSKGSKRINYHPQAVPKIPRSSQMGSGR